MPKAMIKSLENKPLNPWPLESSNPILQLLSVPPRESELPTRITDARQEAVASSITGHYPRIITVNGVIMHYSIAMANMVVLCPINMAAGAILHIVQTLTFAPVDMTIG